jgi:hypothetical protein
MVRGKPEAYPWKGAVRLPKVGSPAQITRSITPADLPRREISILPQVEFREIFRAWNLGIGLFRGEISSKNDKKIK